MPRSVSDPTPAQVDSRVIGISIGIPEPWSGTLRDWRSEIQDPQADLVPPHITLLPPTSVDAAELTDINTHLAEVAARHEAFEVHLSGTGTFQPVSEVVFVTVAAGISRCEGLQNDVRSGPLDRDLRFPYHPHVTVAQDVPADMLEKAYAGLRDFEARFWVETFTVFEQDAGGRWWPVRDFPLHGPEGGSDPS